MRVSLNPINTNTKSNNSNQANFKARAELRLSEAFFEKLSGMQPADAANRAQGIMNVMTVLKSHAPSIGQRKDVIILRDYNASKLIPDWIQQLEMKYYEHSGKYMGQQDVYNEKTISHPDVLSSSFSGMMGNILNRLLGKGRQIPAPKPEPLYGPFFAPDGFPDVLIRKKWDAEGSKVLREEKTIWEALKEELMAICTPPEEQVSLEQSVVLSAGLLRVQERHLQCASASTY